MLFTALWASQQRQVPLKVSGFVEADEIRVGSWLMAPVDPMVILDTPPEEVWNRVMGLIGIDPALLVPGGDAEA